MCEKVVFGIDLGTVNTCIATYNGDEVEIFHTTDGRITPSYVYYDPTSPEIHHGKRAENKLRKKVVYDAKRFIGRRFEDLKVQLIYQKYPFTITSGPDNDIYFEVPYNNENVKKKPEEISAELLRYIKEEVCFKYDVDDVEAVITVPAHFNNNQRDKTKQAAKKAGIKVLKLMNEPTAAALSYFQGGYKKNFRALVFDLGGGTFDISIIDINDKDIIVKATDGDTFLGGRNFDENITKHLKIKLEEQGKTVGNLEELRIKQVARKLKETLSFHNTAEETIEYFFNEDDDEDLSLDRDTFNEINQDEFNKCLDIIERCLENNDIKRDEIEEIIMVGGSSRIPKLKELVQSFFEGKKIMFDLDPDEAVAGGAAIQAFLLSNKESSDDIQSLKMLSIIDINPLSLGINVIYDEMSPVIMRNTPLPVSITKRYVTCYNYQKYFKILIYEGERTYVKFNNLLAKLVIDNIPKKLAREVCVEVTFEIDDDGILNVSAKCEDQQENLAIELNQYDLNSEEVASKIADAVDNKSYDQDFKKFVEAKKKLANIMNSYLYKGDLYFILQETSLEEKDNITRKLEEDNSSKLMLQLKSIWDNYLNEEEITSKLV